MKVKITHESVEHVWQLLSYDMHEWVNNTDLDIVDFLLGQQSGHKISMFSLLLLTVEQNLNTGKERNG